MSSKPITHPDYQNLGQTRGYCVAVKNGRLPIPLASDAIEKLTKKAIYIQFGFRIKPMLRASMNQAAIRNVDIRW